MGDKVMMLTTKGQLVFRKLDELVAMMLPSLQDVLANLPKPPPIVPPETGGGGGDGSGVTSQFGTPPAEVANAIAAVWPRELWRNAADLAYKESSWRPTALNDTVSRYGPCGTFYTLPNGVRAQTEYSRGLFQINGCASPQWNNDGLYDPVENCKAAVSLYQSRGWYPWLYSACGLGLIDTATCNQYGIPHP